MKRKLWDILALVIIPVLLYGFFAFSTEGFGLHSIPVIFNQTMLPTAMGYGMCAVMIVGMCDLSIGARVVLGAVVGGLLSQKFGTVGLVIGCFAGSFAGAAVQAALYRLLRIPAMVLSMGIIMIYEVAAMQLSGGGAHLRIEDSVAAFGSSPFNFVLLILAAVIFYIIFYHTKTGCQLKAVGNDEKLCRSVGIKAEHIKTLAYLFSALMCGFASILSICFSGAISIPVGTATLSMVFKPIMGVLVGMQLAKIYDNLPLLILIGELVIQIIFNGFIAIGLSDSWQNVILGIFIIAVMTLTSDEVPGMEELHRWIRRRNIRSA